MPNELKQIRNDVNLATRWIAYKVYSKYNGNVKFAKAYDRLAGKVYLDHNLSLSKPTDLNEKRAGSMFDTLDIDDMKLVLRSVRDLQSMYDRAFTEKLA